MGSNYKTLHWSLLVHARPFCFHLVSRRYDAGAHMMYDQYYIWYEKSMSILSQNKSFLLSFLVFGVPPVHWRRVKDHMVLQTLEINHRHVHALRKLISRLIGVISRLGARLVD